MPLIIWRSAPWSLWYSNLLAAGNRLDGARLEWTFRVGARFSVPVAVRRSVSSTFIELCWGAGPGKAFVLFWAVHADIFVAAEGRNKSNEVVIARPDIACVLAYMPGEQMLDSEIIVIKEFRSPCRNADAFVYELPGGSSFKHSADPNQVTTVDSAPFAMQWRGAHTSRSSLWVCDCSHI